MIVRVQFEPFIAVNRDTIRLILSHRFSCIDFALSGDCKEVSVDGEVILQQITFEWFDGIWGVGLLAQIV